MHTAHERLEAECPFHAACPWCRAPLRPMALPASCSGCCCCGRGLPRCCIGASKGFEPGDCAQVPQLSRHILGLRSIRCNCSQSCFSIGQDPACICVCTSCHGSKPEVQLHPDVPCLRRVHGVRLQIGCRCFSLCNSEYPCIVEEYPIHGISHIVLSNASGFLGEHPKKQRHD